MQLHEPADSPELRKARGAFFTPEPIADYLADWAVEDDPDATVLDPTCGEAVFLLAAARRLAGLGLEQEKIRAQVLGVDLHEKSVRRSDRLLQAEDLAGTFLIDDFFALETPGKLGSKLPQVDAVIGNPPYIRYQEQTGPERKRAQAAALQQGVRISGLASSWAALVVHACGFLKPDGRLAMVLPAELLTTGYAEQVRLWLKRRFRAVHLVMFERLQFEDALERVVLVLARGTGGCKAFSLVPVEDAADLPNLRMFGPEHLSVSLPEVGKWTDLLLPVERRQLYDRVVDQHFSELNQYGSPTLGTVTGANDFFCINEKTRLKYAIDEGHVARIAPPGTKHFRGLRFTESDWDRLRDEGEAVWLLLPDPGQLGDEERDDAGLMRYLKRGIRSGVHKTYKCSIRDPWYRPPMVPAPDLFFTYMSHRYPRLIRNAARCSFVNSMHGIRLAPGVPQETRMALPLLALNAVTMLGAEIHGRSYGGGVLKMEPREAGRMPVPKPDVLIDAWKRLRPEAQRLQNQLAQGLWTGVAKRVDEALLQGACGLSRNEVSDLHEAALKLRAGRLGTASSMS